jgi:formyltetrahydrofolate-dependent phosphoribosylglycinamide formyltransferase
VSRRRIAVLVSGGGRSLENLCERIAAGELEVEIALVLSDRPGVLALERAARHGLASAVVPRRACTSPADFSARVFAEVERSGAELVVLAGFLSLLPIPAAWKGRVLNIHPALLPAFGGKGFYGDRVHAAVLAAGVPVTGCTVHYVDDQYDHGPILLQRSVDVHAEDTVETLAARVFAEEKRALPEAIRKHFAQH